MSMYTGGGSLDRPPGSSTPEARKIIVKKVSRVPGEGGNTQDPAPITTTQRAIEPQVHVHKHPDEFSMEEDALESDAANASALQQQPVPVRC